MVKNIIISVLLIIISTSCLHEGIEYERKMSEQAINTAEVEHEVELLYLNKVELLNLWYFDDAYQVNIGEIYLDCLLPIAETEQIAEASNKVYTTMIQANVSSFVRDVYNYVGIEYSETDGMILYNYSVRQDSLGGSFSVLVDGTTGKILGCYPGE